MCSLSGSQVDLVSSEVLFLPLKCCGEIVARSVRIGILCIQGLQPVIRMQTKEAAPPKFKTLKGDFHSQISIDRFIDKQ